MPEITLDKKGYQTCLELTHLALAILLAMPTARMREAQSRAHATGPIFQPTLYRDRMSDMAVDERLTEIAAVAGGRYRDLLMRGGLEVEDNPFRVLFGKGDQIKERCAALLKDKMDELIADRQAEQ